MRTKQAVNWEQVDLFYKETERGKGNNAIDGMQDSYK
jgi:hypothetical protein